MTTSSGRPMDNLLWKAIDAGASDIHLQVGSPPIFRIQGEVKFSDLEPLAGKDIEQYVDLLTNPEQRENFKKLKNVDLSYSIPKVAQFRTNIFRQSGGFGMVMRIIPSKIPTVEELGLPDIFKKFAALPSGLVLVTGPTGSGKTTTLAALINYINHIRKGHIIAIEDPTEYIHKNQSSIVTQQEVGRHINSFATGLRGALRGDPDVIVVGEMRDLETISNAITAAETGTLVFGTLHTNDAVQAIDRLIDIFPVTNQQQVRTQLAFALRGVAYQTLLKKKDDSGRIAAFEIMAVNQPIRNLIKENKTHQIYNIMQTSKEEGMQLLNTSLKEMFEQGVITAEEALKKSLDPNTLEKIMLGGQHQSFRLTPSKIF